MANVLVENSVLSAIGNAIRKKTGKTELLLPSQMASEIDAITGSGENNYDESFIGILQGDMENPTFPNGLTSIRDYCFYNNKTIVNPVIPETVKTIDAYAFFNCSNLSLTALPNISTIGRYAFSSCTSLALIELPNVPTIEDNTFFNCSSISISAIPSSITYIGNRAFANCSSIVSLTFKGTPLSISTNAFTNCDNLITINVPWSEGTIANAPWGATNATINYDFNGEAS